MYQFLLKQPPSIFMDYEAKILGTPDNQILILGGIVGSAHDWNVALAKCNMKWAGYENVPKLGFWRGL